LEDYDNMAKKNRNRGAVPQSRKKVEIDPITNVQREYVSAVHSNNITFGIGSAGTGKSYLAALLAMKYMSEGLVNRIVIARPAVPAGGEDIGFLPGGITSKMDPYIRPIIDAFRTYWGASTIQDYIGRGDIEIVPLAFMRGRTFDDTFIIADEMQNATPENLLMLLTRYGVRSKMVITGDPIQSDVNGQSCFRMAERTLIDVPNIEFVSFAENDVVRHDTVRDILNVWPVAGVTNNGVGAMHAAA
jgi:phosphate starvation-inducible PhoH-like protein